jgi:hypothetical protein
MMAVDSGEVPAGAAGGAAGKTAGPIAAGGAANPFADSDPFAIPADESDSYQLGSETERQPGDPEGEQEQQDESRSQKRIRGLIDNLKRATEVARTSQAQLQQFQAWSRQATQQHEQLRAAYHQQQVALARMQERLAAIPRQPGAEEDPVEKFKRDVLGESVQRARQELSPQMQQALQEVQAIKDGLRQQQLQAQRLQTEQKYNQDADGALARHLAPYMTEEGAKKHANRLGAYVLQEAMLTNTDADSAARSVRNFIFEVARDVMARRSATTGARVAAGQQVPPPAPRGRADAKSAEWPAYSALRKAGFKNYVEWQMQGSPKLT